MSGTVEKLEDGPTAAGAADQAAQTTPPASAAVAGPGARLRAAREAQSLSCDEVAKRLNLDAWIIEALEAEDFGRLPERIYVRGYLNAYCKLLNQSSEPICTQFMQDEYQFSLLPAGSLVHKVPVARHTPAWVWPVLVLLVAALGLAAGYEKVQAWVSAQLSLAGDALVAAPVAPASAPAVAEPAVPAVRTARDAAPPPAVPPATEQAKPAVELLVKVKPDTLATTAETPVASTEVKPPAAVGSHKGQGPDRVEIKLEEVSWVELRDATGKRLAYGSLSRGEHSYSGRAPFELTLGHPQGAALVFNGQPFPLPASQKNAVARLTLGAAQPAP